MERGDNNFYDFNEIYIENKYKDNKNVKNILFKIKNKPQIKMILEHEKQTNKRNRHTQTIKHYLLETAIEF